MLLLTPLSCCDLHVVPVADALEISECGYLHRGSLAHPQHPEWWSCTLYSDIWRSAFLSVYSFSKRIRFACVKLHLIEFVSLFDTNVIKFSDMVTKFRHLKTHKWDRVV